MKYLMILIPLFWWIPAQGQDALLKILAADKGVDFVSEELGYQPEKLDSAQIEIKLREIIRSLQEQAFAEANIDSLVQKDSIAIAFLHIGKKYKWQHLSPGNTPPVMLQKIGFSSKKFTKKKFSPTSIHELTEKLLIYTENNGYPFAQIGLDSFRMKNNDVTAQLSVQLGPYIIIEDIEVEGEGTPVNISFLRQYLGVEPGMPYSQSLILSIADRIQSLSYLKLRKPPYITFFGHSALIHLDIVPKNASRFDFLIGVLPNSNSSRQKRVLLTGSFDMELINQLKRGEILAIKVEQLRPLSPRMKLNAEVPYLFKLPIGLDADFSLYKRDSNYIDVRYELGTKYLLNGSTSFRAFVNKQSSILITVDTQLVKMQQRLPDTLDVSRNFYGLAFNKEKLDYRLNPSKGWLMGLKIGAGTRKIKINNQIRAIGQDSLYDQLVLHSFQYKIEGNIASYFTLFPSFVLKGGLQAGFIVNKEPILANEQYRIGGNRLLRGFDEESIFATNYLVATLELRLLLDQQSNLYVFGDFARVDERTKVSLPEDNTIDRALGFGAGVTFAAKVGLFGISLAYGSRKGNPIDFGTPKVHMGFVGRF